MAVLMTINAEGIALVKISEGLRLTAYNCPAGKCTIGYGCTTYADGSPVKSGDTINIDDAEALFDFHIKEAEKAVNELAPGLNQNQFSALVDFVFNFGRQAFFSSRLLTCIIQGKLDQVPSELMRWIHIGVTPNKALKIRRAAEVALWNKKP